MHIICILFYNHLNYAGKKVSVHAHFACFYGFHLCMIFKFLKLIQHFFFQKFSDQKRMTIFFNFQIIMYTCIQKLLNVLYQLDFSLVLTHITLHMHMLVNAHVSNIQFCFAFTSNTIKFSKYSLLKLNTYFMKSQPFFSLHR